MILEPQTKGPDNTIDRLPTPSLRPVRRPLWRRRRVIAVVLGVLLVVSGALVTFSPRSTVVAPSTPAVSAPLIAHGQVVPVQQARVGTLNGGQVQQLTTTLGSDVEAQTPLAWVVGPSGTEVVTAPFSGSVTNIVVHAGDTLTPGATIAVVADLHTLQVETSDVDEFLINHVAVNQRVLVTVDALDNLSLTGIVTHIALLPQAGSAGSQAYPVVVSLPKTPPNVRAGMSVRITLSE